jgi:hypothetical protein
VPFIRYSRDKRGFECTLVMHAYRPSQGPQRTRVLYLFRSPAHLRMGRKPLDAEVVEALEHTHPDLNFDWAVLLREPVRHQEPPRGRPARSAARSSGGRRPQSRPAPPPPEAAAPLVDDQSMLGRVLGARAAGRLRAAYSDLLQRIVRRARTPEDRDRLSDRAARLNPDDWADESAVTAGAQTVESEWDAIAAELPQRRRGRRGGRRRSPDAEAGGREPSAGAGEPSPERSGPPIEATPGGATEASGIMAEGGDIHDREPRTANRVPEDPLDRPDRGADDDRDDGGPPGAAEPGPADDL